MSARLHWLWFSTCAALRPMQRAALLSHFGEASAIYAADREAFLAVSGLQKAQVHALCDKNLEEAEEIAATCERLGIAIVTIADTSYPDRLRQIPDPPAVLYVRGTMPDLDTYPGIAVVGTRHASAYGRTAAETMARQLAQAGFIIVSGMAAGIDGEANRAALRAGGKTVAVLGCGVDVCYPSHHKALMGDILLAGAVISEYPPGAEPAAAHFPARNRIISGLSVGVLVVEAPQRSGSLITAHCALDQGRDVFVVPGNIGVAGFIGSNRMIADGEAMLVASAQDIIREYDGLLGARAQPVRHRALPWERARKPHKKPKPSPHKNTNLKTPPEDPGPFEKEAVVSAHLTDEERAILQAVQNGANTVDEIIDAVGLPTAQVTASITMLELDGILTRESGRLCTARAST